MKRLIIITITAALIAAGCTKDIKLNLRSDISLLVIEGNITDLPGPYTVLLSKSVAYYDSNNAVPVSGGRVVISDNAGNRDSLTEVSPGVYRTSTIMGTVGRTYHLSVNSGGLQYDAYSTMNPPVPVDSLGVTSSLFGGNKQVSCVFQDPAGVTNYYNAVMYQNWSRQPKADPVSDKLNDGLIINSRIRSNGDINLYDTIYGELDAIDQPMYNYWSTLNGSTLNGQTVAPANPLTNISGNVLGYFSAYSPTYSDTIVIDNSPAGYHRLR